jgi:type II secretory pathway component GspD/PulD (secretin)
MVKFSPSLCACGLLAVSSAFSQLPTVPTPVSLPPGVSPEVGTIPRPQIAPSVPAPIDPPLLKQQTVAPADVLSVPSAEGAAHHSSAIEFQGEEIGLVLRSLARQAGVTMIVSDKVAQPGNTVTARIEKSTPLQAIQIIVESKGLILDEKNGVFTVKTSEERAKEPTVSGSYTLSYGQAKDIVPLLATQLQSGVAPQFDQRTNTLFFRESKSNMDAVMVFLRSIDRPTQQVMIEARLVEVTANPKQSYGINWAGVVGGSAAPQVFRYGGSGLGEPPSYVIDNTGRVSATPGRPATASVDEASGRLKGRDLFFDGRTTGNFLGAISGQFAILSVPQMSATLRLLNEDSDAEFLANPRVVTANNQKAEIKIIRQQPVPQLNFNEQTAQAVFSGFQDKEFGNTLEVTPSINQEEFISLTVKPEISNKVGDQTFSFGGSVVTSPIIDKRSLNSNVLIRSGNTLAIGGLLQDETIKNRTKVPILGDIPILGYAFQERLNGRSKRNLLVFVTPTILRQAQGTGLEDQVSGLLNSGEEYADPNGWRNNARGAYRLVPTSQRQLAADIPKPGIKPAPKRPLSKSSTPSRVP